MSEHTPGPWKVDGDTIAAGTAGPEYRVMAPGEESGEIEANAKLIAAAPEMLRALKGFQEWWDEWYRNPNPTTVSDPPIHQARAAIAKAKEDR